MAGVDPDVPRLSRRWIDLALGVRAGDRGSEDDLVRTFSPSVAAMTFGRLWDREMARELTQEILMEVLQALRKGLLREPAKLPAFVLGTARNMINHRLQEMSVHPAAVPLDPDHPPLADGGPPSSPQEARSEDDERKAIVRRVLQTLKPLDRQILYLTLAEGLKPQEIAREVGLKAENVRNRKSRALKVLQRKMARLIRNSCPGHLYRER